MTDKSVLALAPNPTVDKSSSIEQVAPEIKLRCNQPIFEPGGGGVNVARVLHRFDVVMKLVYPAGGSQGDFLADLLDREKLNHESVSIDGMTRESFMVLETSSGQQYRFSEPGPELSSDEWESLMRRLENKMQDGVTYLVGSGSLPPGAPGNGYAEIGNLAKQHDVKFILDTSGEYLRKGIEGQPYMIKPNLRELQQIVDRSLDGDDEILAAAAELVDRRGIGNVVVSLGAGGALLANGGRQCTYRAPTVPIESKVGAGDSMVGGIVYGLIQTGDLLRAVQYGVAAGSAAVQTPGTELCYRDDVERLYKRVEIRKRG